MRNLPVQVTLIDRRNFHLFQPLLYQVATGWLSPANIASTLRAVLRYQDNARVLLAEVTGIDTERRTVLFAGGEIGYDTLIVASGSSHHYFGHDEWEALAPGLKTIEDATEMRRRIFSAFESAERETDPAKIRAWLTFIIVGGGPTGVELAGALADLANQTLTHDFRSIDPTDAQILLLEASERILSTYPEELSTQAQHFLKKVGVSVQLATAVTQLRPGEVVGWPIPCGGAQKLTDALVAFARSLGVEFFMDRRIATLSELPAARAVLCDVTPRQLLKLAGEELPASFQRQLQSYRYGMGAFKIDWALSAPVPWKAAACARAATVHVGGSLEEIAASEHAAARGDSTQRPFVLLAQPSLFDDTRAPAGKHTLWGYCHVPHGSNQNRLDQIESQIERFAPGFRDVVLARSTRSAVDLELHNANLIGGDINGGSAELGQLFLRPSWRMYGTPTKGLYLCSASTPPGGGVHGMCGYFAARLALRQTA